MRSSSKVARGRKGVATCPAPSVRGSDPSNPVPADVRTGSSGPRCWPTFRRRQEAFGVFFFRDGFPAPGVEDLLPLNRSLLQVPDGLETEPGRWRGVVEVVRWSGGGGRHLVALGQVLYVTHV